jgi:RNA polymerase sigma-70 factor (ECF subfamily)
MPAESDETLELLEGAGRGDRRALDRLFGRHRERLLRMARLRMDRRLMGRIDASDIVQEVQLQAWKRLSRYLRDRTMSFFIWLRFLTEQHLKELLRRNLGAKARDVRREVRRAALPGASSVVMAEMLSAGVTTPSRAVARDERERRIRAALDALPEADREILSLRHFEGLKNREVAEELGLEPPAASKRYVRALGRLKGALEDVPGLVLP